MASGRSPAYNCRCAWALAYAGETLDDERLTQAARRNCDWVLAQQSDLGWFSHNGFTDTQVPLLHTISYVIEGLVGVYAFVGDDRYLLAAQRALDPIVAAYQAGRMAGHFDADWRGTVPWRCVTGDAQIAVVLHRLDAHCPGQCAFSSRTGPRSSTWTRCSCRSWESTRRASPGSRSLRGIEALEMGARAKRVLAVVGTRPNFMKIAPILAELDRRDGGFETTLVHTGQHYDAGMSDVFFEQLGIAAPDYLLEVGSGPHGRQTARIMERLEPVLEQERPDVVLVPGDVNSTLAAALVASKLQIPIGHVEAGLRSFDRTMPEEINRVLTDCVSQLLFTHSPEAERHLLSEGADQSAIHYVGNTMIDTLVALRPRLQVERTLEQRGLSEGGYLLVTLHRPALVDGPMLSDVIGHLTALARDLPVLFPAHPRTRKSIEALALSAAGGLEIVEPLGYLEFLSLVSAARAVLTDSGGIQEESTFLGVPCLTLRDNTERPVTVEMGTNVLLGLRPDRLPEIPRLIEEVQAREVKVPPLWDGAAAERIADVLQTPA